MIYDECELIDFFNTIPQKDDEYFCCFESNQGKEFHLNMTLDTECNCNVSLRLNWNNQIIFSENFKEVVEIKIFKKDTLVIKLKDMRWIMLEKFEDHYTIKVEDKSDLYKSGNQFKMVF